MIQSDQETLNSFAQRPVMDVLGHRSLRVVSNHTNAPKRRLATSHEWAFLRVESGSDSLMATRWGYSPGGFGWNKPREPRRYRPMTPG